MAHLFMFGQAGTRASVGHTASWCQPQREWGRVTPGPPLAWPQPPSLCRRPSLSSRRVDSGSVVSMPSPHPCAFSGTLPLLTAHQNSRTSVG